MGQQVVDGHFAGRHQFHAFEVARRRASDCARRRSIRRRDMRQHIDQQNLVLRFERRQRLRQRLGLVVGQCRTPEPPSIRRRAASPTEPSAARPTASCEAACRHRSAAPVRGPCRHDATAANGSNPYGRGRCPSASTASCPNPTLRGGSWSWRCRRAARRDSAGPLRKSALSFTSAPNTASVSSTEPTT